MQPEYKTLAKLDGIVSRLHTHPEYSACVRDATQRTILEQGAYHSHLLELNGEAKITPELKAEVKRHLEETWEHLGREGITTVSISKLGYLIEPEKNPTKAFRVEAVAYGGFHPPPADRVPFEIDNLVYRLGHTGLHPVIRAADAHIDLVRVHPFMDGNGRAARLLQNFCLQERGYPAVVIESHERQVYLGLMQQTLKERYNGESNAQKPSAAERLFHEFIISKIVNSAQDIESELRSRRSYEIAFAGTTGQLYTLAQHIRKIGGAERPITVSVQRNKNNLLVRGDVSTEELEKEVARISGAATIRPNWRKKKK